MAHEFDEKKYEKASSHQKEWGAKLVSELVLNGNERVLDLGCGDGVYIIYFFSAKNVFQRKMYWIEAIVIANIMPWIFPYIAYTSGRYSKAIGLIEFVGITLFLTGSYLNSGSEFLRYSWKKKRENAGRIYTGGFFKHAMHINYFGDIVLFTGMAMIAHQFQLLFIPISMAFIFIVILIPLKENYLREKYGDEFISYASNTKKLIPLIF